MKPTVSHILHDALLGLAGTAAPILAAIASWQEQVEWGLRILGMFAGITVSVVTIMSLRAAHKSRAKARVEEETEQNKQ